MWCSIPVKIPLVELNVKPMASGMMNEWKKFGLD